MESLENGIVSLIKMKSHMSAEITTRSVPASKNDSEENQKRLKLLHTRLKLVDILLSLLTAEQLFVIDHRLVGGMTWSALASEYAARWPFAPRVERTLMRKQADALRVIFDFSKGHTAMIRSLVEGIDEEGGLSGQL